MAVKIKFDKSHNVLQPTFVLATKGGKKLGTIPAYDIHAIDNFNSYFELSFKVQKYSNNEKYHLWDELTDFKIVWCKEYKICFEIKVRLNEEDDTYKVVTCRSLCESELSQIKTGNVEANTEDDIAREDYIPTVLYDQNDKKKSLLDKILSKAPHYKVKHVDPSIKSIQRTFILNDDILSACNTIAQEINCIFIFDSNITDEGKVARTISVYDLESYCAECGTRGDFVNHCSKCGSENILPGYGEDTAIFVSRDNLADNITYETDVDSVKNCFKLVAGDDLMTATIASCNPNGTSYLWYISDELKKDMSDELVQRLNEYDEMYNYYMNDYISELNKTGILSTYNALVEKYKPWNDELNKVSETEKGYSALMNAYFETIDMNLYLSHSMMPSVSTQKTTAEIQANSLKNARLSPVAVSKLSSASHSTVSSAVLAIVKTVVSPLYQVKINDSSYNSTLKRWQGSFILTNYSDDEDTAISESISVELTESFESYVNQVAIKALNKEADEATDIVGLFSLKEDNFKNEIKKYSLARLNAFHESCIGCINILIQQGIADDQKYKDSSNNLYESIYIPYYNKMLALESEIQVRENEILQVTGSLDENNQVKINGLQTVILAEQEKIQSDLDFQKFLGEDLWLEFVSYRREDEYSNDNFISDGLDNSQLFNRALEFLEMARKDIYKSATLQHTITSSLKNLLVMKEFSPIVDYFCVGNWIRIKIDGKVYKLRIMSYEVDYSNLENISITFSDVKKTMSGISDFEDIMNKAASIASSYDFISRQANQGKKGNDKLQDWALKGLALTKMKIIDDADNQNIVWDSHGLLCREHSPITDDYNDKQLKILNRGLYVTDDNWKTSRAGIGDFAFYNPETGQYEESYGVIADTIVGNLVLSERVGVYNTNNSIALNEDGLTITTLDGSTDDKQMSFTIQKKTTDVDGNEKYEKQMYIDKNGNVVINGTFMVQSPTGEDKSFNEIIESIESGGGSQGLVKSVFSVDVEYYLSTSYTKPTGGSWSTTAPSWDSDKYMWSRTKTTFNDNTIAYSPSENGTCIIGVINVGGEDDDTHGKDGRGISDIVEEYYLSTSKTEQTDGEWSTTAPTWEEGKYIWTRTKISYINPTSIEYTTPVCDTTWEGLNDSLNKKIDDEAWRLSGEIEQGYEDAVHEATEQIDNKFKELSESLAAFMENNRLDLQGTHTSIDSLYEEILEATNNQLNAYKAELGQYMRFSGDGLTFGSQNSLFKTVVDNRGMYFKDDNRTIAYVNGSQLFISNAVIENTLNLGKFFFSPRLDGGVSLTWQGE